MILMVPIDEQPWPSLGGQVCDFIERNLVFGPGDLRGQPAILDDETRGLIFRMYEVYPKNHQFAGRRRFKRVGLSLRKGTAKTEKAAWIAACELHPEAPVRCTGFTKKGEPIGGPVSDPYIPLVAYTEEQSEDLAYGALRVIIELSHLRDDFDIGLERIMRKKGDGKAVALAAAPDSRDGARTTWQHFDESHRMTSARLIGAHQTMLANIPKRQGADAWTLETTTAPEPGAGSIAESTMEYARSIATGAATDARLFFFHRQAGDEHILTMPDGTVNAPALRAAVLEASGSAAKWSDIESIVEQWANPMADRAYLERVWLNRLVKGGSQAFDVVVWKKLKKPGYQPKPGALIVVGFDGGKNFDSTGIVATEVETGYQWKVGVWERPASWPAEKEWKVPAAEVDACMVHLFDTYAVWRLYADPPYWQDYIAIWQGRWSEEVVIEWWTNRDRQMTVAIEGFTTAIADATISHDGDPDVVRHLGNARKRDLNRIDEQGKKLYVIQKERKDSPHKMDLAMCAVLSWEARTDAIAADALSADGEAARDFAERGLFV